MPLQPRGARSGSYHLSPCNHSHSCMRLESSHQQVLTVTLLTLDVECISCTCVYGMGVGLESRFIRC